MEPTRAAFKWDSAAVRAAAVRAAAGAVAYLALAHFGALLILPDAVASPFWPAAGLAAGLVLAYGYRASVPIALGVLLFEATAPFPVAPTSVPLHLLGAVGGAALVRLVVTTLLKGPPAFATPREILAFIAAAAAGSAAASTMGLLAFSSVAPNGVGAPVEWLVWWMGDFAGCIAVGPLVLQWTRKPAALRKAMGSARWRLTVGGAVAGYGGILVALPQPLALAAVSVLALPAVVIATYRLGPRGATTMSFLAASAAALGAAPVFGSDSAISHPSTLAVELHLIGILIAALFVAAERGARRRAARRARESERLRESILDHIQDLILLKTPDSRLVWVNRAVEEFYGVKVERLEGALGAPETDSALVDQYTRDDRVVVETRRLLTIPATPAKRRDGTTRYFDTLKAPILDSSGEVRLILAVCHDVTDRLSHEATLEEARSDAERANRVKSMFLASMSHELRTPLNAIIGFSEMIRSGYAGPTSDRAGEYVGMIHSSAEYLLALIENIMDIVKIEAGKADLDNSRFCLAELVEECLPYIDPPMRAKAITLTVQNAATRAAVVADRVAIKRVILNLMSNAVKFTPEGGAVGVDIRPVGDGALALSVADSGPGVPPDAIKTLFEPFQQGDPFVRREHGGTGLGLWISRNLARAHGGDLTIESAEGRGATATLVIPTRDPEMPRARAGGAG